VFVKQTVNVIVITAKADQVAPKYVPQNQQILLEVEEALQLLEGELTVLLISMQEAVMMTVNVCPTNVLQEETVLLPPILLPRDQLQPEHLLLLRELRLPELLHPHLEQPQQGLPHQVDQQVLLFPVEV
jgi:hypothetical protein